MLLLLSASVCFSALLLLAVNLVCLLVRGLASRCSWLSLAGLPRAAPGVAVVVWWLLLSLRPGLPWLLPLFPPLLVLVFSFPRPGAPGSLSLAVAPSCLGRGWGPSARLRGCFVAGVLVVLGAAAAVAAAPASVKGARFPGVLSMVSRASSGRVPAGQGDGKTLAPLGRCGAARAGRGRSAPVEAGT